MDIETATRDVNRVTLPMTYAVYGVTIRSDLELEILDQVSAPSGGADITVKRVTGIVRSSHEFEPHFDIQPDIQYFHWTAIGAFIIEADGNVLVELHEGISDLLASHALLGLVMSVVLERRGVLCLHASAVEVAGRAVVFMGDKGAGKSTTTGAMLAKGHSPITDDLVPVLNTDTSPVIYPGFSSTKLYPDSVKALGMRDEETDREIHFSTEKKQKEFSVPLVKSGVPAGALCVLCRSKDVTRVSFKRLAAHEALQIIMRFTFKARYGETKLGRDSLIMHMKHCAGLAATVPVYNLFIPDDLAQLDVLGDAIEAHILSELAS